MNKYKVTLKYGEIGKVKNTSTTIIVEAESDTSAMILAKNIFRNKNSSNQNKEVDAVGCKKI